MHNGSTFIVFLLIYLVGQKVHEKNGNADVWCNTDTIPPPCVLFGYYMEKKNLTNNMDFIYIYI